MIAVAGGFGVGMTMRLHHAPEAGETVTGGVLASGPGGKGSNQAIAIARLGHSVALFTAVGDDSAGRDAYRLWSSEGVAWEAVVVSPASTMTGFILVDGTGENRIAIAPGALAQLEPRHVERFRGRIREADLLVVSLELPWDVARRALEVAAEEGTPRLLNPAPATVPVGDLVGIADIVTPNASEARALLGVRHGDDRSERSLAIELSTAIACDVVLTLGSRGAIVVQAGVATEIPPHPVEVTVDTTGAGDAFTAALAVAVAESVPLADAARWAARAGAYAVGIAEVVPALATRSDLGEPMMQQKEHR
jgi:ribokinase